MKERSSDLPLLSEQTKIPACHNNRHEIKKKATSRIGICSVELTFNMKS